MCCNRLECLFEDRNFRHSIFLVDIHKKVPSFTILKSRPFKIVSKLLEIFTMCDATHSSTEVVETAVGRSSNIPIHASHRRADGTEGVGGRQICPLPHGFGRIRSKTCSIKWCSGVSNARSPDFETFCRLCTVQAVKAGRRPQIQGCRNL